VNSPSFPVGSNNAVSEWAIDPSWNPWAYWIDACQRTILVWDVMRQRSEGYAEHAAKTTPHVLKFGHELVMDGRRLPRPVNYGLVRVVPPDGTEIDVRKRPFVVVDPRAGHGPGIGGFKADSEIGVAFKAGHPCYLIGFVPDPVPGQTIEDIAHAEAAFLERVIALHPQAEGKPAVVGNCQAGWAVMLLAAMRPELFGPIIIAGSPLSYWAGVHGRNPMRYSGGLLGGSFLTALTSDLGNGKFDGAWLVANFENLNPANTLWTKQYNLYEKIDTEVPRYLKFEQYWGGYVFLNADEMQFIVDELFIGNRLATAEITASDGSPVDLRNIRSPIVVFCSKADNITPPQQALDWILDLYRSVDDIRAHDQTIVYAVHESAGHLGIFFSGSVAKKEHAEFASNIDLIDVLPPGLYEAVMVPKDVEPESAHLLEGDYLVRFETRTLDDIRAMGGNNEEDDQKFAAVARLSEINLGLYRTFVQPWVRSWANEGFAKWMRQWHPLRLQYEILSPNAFVHQLRAWGEVVKRHRQPVSKDNVCWQTQERFADWVKTSLDAYRDLRDHASEALFHGVYGSPFLQALIGLKASDTKPRRMPGEHALHKAFVAQCLAELMSRIAEGGPREAAIRALLYVRMPEGTVDERSFNLLRQMRDEAGGLTLAAFKELVREQFFMLLLDERRAIAAIPGMLEKDPKRASRMASIVQRVIDAVGLRSELERARLAEVEALFERAEAGAGTSGLLEHEEAALARVRLPRSQAAGTSKH
jgi:poly(3-hydroxyalkanoate) synthetase